MSDTHYDVIIIGSGPGGGSMAHRLAPTGKRILILERGDYLPREQANWDAKTVFVDGKYQTKEVWYGTDGKTFHPGLHYYVGGNSKVYGAALIRLRERDFDDVEHSEGIAPAWPIKYAELEPYYGQAEALFHVHGQWKEDPNEPPRSDDFPYPPVSHEPMVQNLSEGFARQGLNPFHLPLGIMLDERNGKATPTSICIRCNAFDGFPCLLNGKADAQVVCIDPTVARFSNVTLLTGAYAKRLETNPAGTAITGVQVVRHGVDERYTAETVVVACGSLSSALLFLRSATDKHPNGLANRSGQVGRNYMRHNQSVLMALLKKKNTTVFQKTLGVSDFYFGSDDWKHPLGLIQMCATTQGPQISGEEVPAWMTNWLPNTPFDVMADHALDFWLSSEDLPRPENRILYDGERVVLDLHENNMEAHRRLRAKLKEIMTKEGAAPVLLERKLYFGKDIPIGGTAHQAGTLRFGTDPETSVLDLNCKAHEIDNLYVTDASFFPSIGAVNPTLTIVANALRVADHLKARMGVADSPQAQPARGNSYVLGDLQRTVAA
ncbi:GMC family oxidoreductase [Lichenihabitans sp. Uapishka_5]|uniref:GMC family oxidoreductase n=1 Tax=Lichenihabitans sp. Uapishka_5 TaxID=3037302 RepID=UPI0029E7E731|nr:GMC family oxidoreductase [Lichenihabitans sp. Uapishka_5]MDX7949723.1 GMC family oxidoreductase [Lichenihabitans sp. Uapishka_5]